MNKHRLISLVAALLIGASTAQADYTSDLMGSGFSPLQAKVIAGQVGSGPTFATATISGAATLSSTLGVTGASTFASTVSIGDTALRDDEQLHVELGDAGTVTPSANLDGYRIAIFESDDNGYVMLNLPYAKRGGFMWNEGASEYATGITHRASTSGIDFFVGGGSQLMLTGDALYSSTNADLTLGDATHLWEGLFIGDTLVDEEATLASYQEMTTGAQMELVTVTEAFETNSGATAQPSSNILRAGVAWVGCNWEVLETISGPTTWEAGTPSDLDRFCNGKALTAGTKCAASDYSVIGFFGSSSASLPRISTDGGSDFTDGKVQVTCFGWDFTNQ